MELFSEKVKDCIIKYDILNFANIYSKMRARPRRNVKKGANVEYLIITRGTRICGLFSFFISFLIGIEEADRRGLIPVIDGRTYSSPYLYPKEIGRINFWEYYFQQPGNQSLDEAYAGNYERIHIPGFSHVNIDLFNNKDGILDKGKALCEQYIHLQPDIERKFNSAQKKYFSGRGRILGVSCRGTDYIAQKSEGHAVQPTPHQVIEQIDIAMATGGSIQFI